MPIHTITRTSCQIRHTIYLLIRVCWLFLRVNLRSLSEVFCRELSVPQGFTLMEKLSNSSPNRCSPCSCLCGWEKEVKKKEHYGFILAFEHLYVHVWGAETLLESLEGIAFPVWLLKAEARIRPGPKFTAAQLSHPPSWPPAHWPPHIHIQPQKHTISAKYTQAGRLFMVQYTRIISQPSTTHNVDLL